MFQPLEVELIKAVASNPKEFPQLLISPKVGFNPLWLTTPLSQKLFSVVTSDALDYRDASMLRLMSSVKMSPEQYKELKAIWDSGKGQVVDASNILETLRQQYVTIEASKAILDSLSAVKEDPSKYRATYMNLVARLDQLVHCGESYDPTPYSPSTSPMRFIRGQWGDPVYDSLFEIRTDEGDYQSGIINYASVLWVAPTKHGKSTNMYTLSALSALSDIEVLYITNEPTKDEVTWNIHNAIRGISRDDYGGEMSKDDIQSIVKKNVKIYERVFDFEEAKKRIHWHRPAMCVIDSLDSLGFPNSAKNFKNTDEQHRERAVQLRDMAGKYETIINVPANASDDGQRALRDGDIDKVNTVKPFGSIWYPNIMDESLAFVRDREQPNKAFIKRITNRSSGRWGEVYELNYVQAGSYYKGVGYRQHIAL